MPELTTLGAVIKATYEGEPDTNAFTDEEKSKLAAINPEDIGAVKSVNSKTGEVVLTAADVGALPDSYTPPAAPVQSVAGKTGAVALEVGDVTGLQDIIDDLEQRLAALEGA